jgi:hypothetical protein
MKEKIGACFTFVQLPGDVLAINGHVTSCEDGIEHTQRWEFTGGDLDDAESPLQWMQMALARACDGI